MSLLAIGGNLLLGYYKLRHSVGQILNPKQCLCFGVKGYGTVFLSVIL